MLYTAAFPCFGDIAVVKALAVPLQNGLENRTVERSRPRRAWIRMTRALALFVALHALPALAEPAARGRLRAPEPVGEREETRRRSAVRERCSENVDDPHCRNYLELEIARSIRALERAERKLYPNEAEYCSTHPRDRGCPAVLRREDKREKERARLELKRYCMENPDAPRCGISLFGDDEPPAAAAASPSPAPSQSPAPETRPGGELFSPSPSALFGEGPASIADVLPDPITK